MQRRSRKALRPETRRSLPVRPAAGRFPPSAICAAAACQTIFDFQTELLLTFSELLYSSRRSVGELAADAI